MISLKLMLLERILINNALTPPTEPTNTSSAALITALQGQGYSVVNVPVTDIRAAAESTGIYASHPNDVVYLIQNGTAYGGTGYFFNIIKGGLNSSRKRYFIGQNRHQVVLTGKVGIYADNIVLQNFKMDMSTYDQGSSYSTITSDASGIELRDLTLVSAYPNGAKNGGAIEVDSGTILIDGCLVDGFGGSGSSGGSQDHGIYLSGTNDAIITNCIVRNNCSRGIQMYSSAGPGVMNNILIRNNLLYSNGQMHGVTERNYGSRDNIVISDGAGDNIMIEHNFIWDGLYSGIRFATAETTNVVVRNNTFYKNGVRSISPEWNPSEIHLEDVGLGAGTFITKNIFEIDTNRELCNGYVGDNPLGRGFSIDDNVIYGRICYDVANPNWIINRVLENPQFVDPAAHNFVTQNSNVVGYGYYE